MSYDEESCTAILCNHGCNWDCSICSYKLRGDLQPSRFLSTEAIIDILSSVKIENVVLLGGEPLTCEDLDVIVGFAKEELEATGEDRPQQRFPVAARGRSMKWA